MTGDPTGPADILAWRRAINEVSEQMLDGMRELRRVVATPQAPAVPQTWWNKSQIIGALLAALLALGANMLMDWRDQARIEDRLQAEKEFSRETREMHNKLADRFNDHLSRNNPSTLWQAPPEPEPEPRLVRGLVPCGSDHAVRPR